MPDQRSQHHESRPCCERGDRPQCGARGWGSLLEPAILAVLGTGGGHGYDLRKDVQEMTGGCVCADTGGTYRVLRRLEEQGFVVSRWTAGEAGPQRREYDLTAEGRALLAHWREHLAERKATIDAVIGGVDEALTAAQDTAGTNSAGRAEQRRKGVDHG